VGVCDYSEACGDLDSPAILIVRVSAMESSSFIESVMEAREDPQTSTAVFCFAIPFNQTVWEPWMHCF